MKQSEFLSLNFRDIARGLLMAILTPVVVLVQQSIEAGVFTFDWKALGLASLAGGVAYLAKNFFTPKPINSLMEDIGLPKPPKGE
jgi:hypothetical protein